MKKGVRVRSSIISGVIALLLVCTCASGAYVKDISITLDFFAEWFVFESPGTSHVQLNHGIQVGIINTYDTSPQYQYEMREATISLSACNLIIDNNQGGTDADGDFAGGAQLSISGQLWNKSTNQHIYTGTLLVADMYSDPWNLEELTLQSVIGSNLFIPVSGELVTGGSVIIGSDFTAGFNFSYGDTVTDFSTQSYEDMITNIQMFAEIPEPASMFLLITGGGCLLAFRKK